MIAFLSGLIKRLTSRKFLLTLSAALVLVANQQWTELVALVSVYVGSEGLGDAAERYKAQDVKKADVLLENTKVELGQFSDFAPATADTNTFVPGNEIPAQ